MNKYRSSKGNAGQALARQIFSFFCTAPKNYHSGYNSVQRALDRGAGPLALAAIAGNSYDWCRQIKVKLISLFLFCVVAACGSGTCSSVGVDNITQYGARVTWQVTSAQPPTLQYHELIWLPTATYVSNGNSFGSSPNVVGLNSLSEASNTNLAGIIFNAPAATSITYSPISSDTTATTAGGVYSSTNACSNVVGSFTTGAAQTFSQIHPTGPSIFTPPTSFAITGTTWTEGSNCGTGTPSGATMMDCINAANSGSPTDGVLLANANHVCTNGQCVMPSPTEPSSTFTQFGIVTSSPAVFETTDSTIPFTNGQAVTLNSTNALPNPLVPGPAGNSSQDAVYYVCTTSCSQTGNDFQLKDYTNTLVSTLATTGSGTFYIQAWPPPSTYHIIDVQTSSSLLPPNGVRLDPAAYGSALATVTFDNASLECYLMVGNWIWRHTQFVPQATGSIADPKGVPALIQFDTGGTSGGVNNFVFDQDWFNGPTRPDREQTELLYVSGANFAIQNSAITNAQNWTPVTMSTLTVSGSVVTMGAGEDYYQGHNCSIASSLSATFGGSGAVNFYFDQSCNPTIAPGAGVTVSSATGWTVLSAASVTAGTFPVDSNSRWSVYPVGFATVTSGSVSITDVNSAASLSQLPGVQFYDCNGAVYGSAESGATTTAQGCTSQEIYIAAPPGPYSFVNNSWDGGGIEGPYFNATVDNGCPNSGSCPAIPSQPHDVYMHRNTYTLHKDWVPSLGAPWDYGWMSNRNGPEFKGVQRVLIDGEVFNTMISDIDPGGPCLGISNLTGGWAEQQASDVEIGNSTFLNCGEGLNLVGSYNTTPANAVPQRIWLHNNLGEFSLNPDTLFSVGQLYPNGSLITGSNTLFDIIFEHNTWLGRGGGIPAIFALGGGPCMGCVLQNNVVDITGATGGTAYADIFYGSAPGPALVPAIASSGNALIADTLSTFASNVFVPTWTDYNSGSPVSWTSGQLAAYESAWAAGVTFQSGSTFTATASGVGWFNVNPMQSANSNFRLKSASPYISGAHASTDGLDVGADIDQLESHQGKVSNVHTYGTTSSSTTVGFLAPDSFGCTVDYGPSPFWTGSGTWTRLANAGGQRVQNVSLTALNPSALYYYRVNCSVYQPTGTFTTLAP